MGDLVHMPQNAILNNERGTAFIPDSVLIQMESGGKHPAEAAMQWMHEQNPGFRFSAVYDPTKRGATFYWGPIESEG